MAVKSASFITKITTLFTSVKYYNQDMKEYIRAIFPADFKHSTALWRAFILGAVMLSLVIAQLFKFEEFPILISAMNVPGEPFTPWLLAILLPLFEIASLPYLISMKTDGNIRRVSKWSGFVACIIWVLLTTWTSVTMGMSVESGIFGGTLATNSGWWSVLFATLLTWSYWLTMRELPKRRDS